MVSRVGVASTPTSSGAQAPAVTTTAFTRSPPSETVSPSSSIDSIRVLLAQLRPGIGRGTEQRLQRQIGIDDPAVGLKEPGLVTIEPEWEAPLDFGRIQHLEWHPAGRERISIRLPVAEVECPGLVEQRTPERGLELLPERICLLRKPNPAFVGIGEPDDSRAAVTRALSVSDLELLVDHDVVSRLSERRCGCETHYSGADDGDLGVGARLHDLSVPQS